MNRLNYTNFLRENLYQFIDYLNDNIDSLENQKINYLTLDYTNKHFIKFNTFLKNLKLDLYENNENDVLYYQNLDQFEEAYLYAIEFQKINEYQRAQEQFDIAYSYLIINYELDFDI